jgi:hypothetical protein
MSSVAQALFNAQLELSFLHGCRVTDRPDIPVTAETSWQIDNTKVLKEIDEALTSLLGEYRRCPECGCCSSPLLNLPTQAQPKCGAGRSDSETPCGGCL